MRAGSKRLMTAFALAFVSFMATEAAAQTRSLDETTRPERRGPVRSVTIPVTVRLPERRGEQAELQYIDALTVLEDGEPQEILATRGAPQARLTLAVLIQDDLVGSVNNEIRGLAAFIRRLPPGSHVMVAYLRAGSLNVRQKFTDNLERAANALRIPTGSPGSAPYNPYALARDAIKKFESQPVGRRAVLLISDGLDTSRGVDSSTATQSVDLQRAINEAQRRSVAVYSFYAPSTGGTAFGNQLLIGNGQGSLQRLATETGGRAFFQGTSAPVSFEPFLRDLDTLLARQFALTYLSTHSKKGFHSIRIVADLNEGSIHYPQGYTR